MKKKIIIMSSYLNNNKLELKANESIKGLLPAEQILVDSDEFSFIYLTEDQQDYTYIVLPDTVWPQLNTALEQKIPVWISFNEQQMELTNFHDELDYVISNIQGNSNYGEEMVKKVEEMFKR
jgi:Family of unknown function (UPF0738)